MTEKTALQLAYSMGYEDKMAGRMHDSSKVESLGRGKCRAVSMRERDKRPYLHDELVCSECGCQLAHEFEHVWQRFCPNCGREIEQ